jgi:hypothetical protein
MSEKRFIPAEELPPGRYGNLQWLGMAEPVELTEEEKTYPVVELREESIVLFDGELIQVSSPRPAGAKPNKMPVPPRPKRVAGPRPPKPIR